MINTLTKQVWKAKRTAIAALMAWGGVAAAMMPAIAAAETWVLSSQDDWTRQADVITHMEVKDGVLTPTAETAAFRSSVKTFKEKRTLKSIVFEQIPDWQNWSPVAPVGPANLGDAPIFLALGPGNYWMFGLYGGLKKPDDFEPTSAELEGFDMELQTTPDPHQYKAPGGLQPNLGGYHAWQSRDMVNWVHHGNVTERASKWATTAEYADGKLYIYYDYPNDQDPHLYIDDDLTDGKPGKNMGLVFADPSDGSDCGVIRDLEGRFHMIYEDWTPINARKHQYDSPLAGHAVSENGIRDWKILEPAVDERTEPTGEVGTYPHKSWDHMAEYQVHKPEQNAFGDWAVIAVGGQYYLFGDFHPVEGQMGIGWFTSDDINKPFRRCGKIGQGHPDPDIGFAEGRFYLVTQMNQDFTSPGPWVEKVEARVGVDTTDDGMIDTWTDWTEVKETYSYTEGFAKQIGKTPAAMDLSGLPAGHAVQFEFRTTQTTENGVRPVMDNVVLKF